MYTPFIEKNVAKIADAIDQSQQKKLAQSAYMGDQTAMSGLMAANPQLAQQIQQSKMRDEQAKLQQATAAKQAQDAHVAKVQGIAANIAKFDNFNDAAAYAQQAASEAGINAPPLDVSHYEQFKKIYGDRISAKDQAELDIKKQNANSKGDYTQQQIDIANKRLELQSQINDARIQKLENPPEKPLTDSQSKALVFGSRMQEADKIINQLADEGVTRKGNFKSAVGDFPLLGSIANAVQSPKEQQVEQGQRDFINAVLRRESGASISPSEFENAKKQYFVSIGDSKEVVAQKAKNRELAIKGMLHEVPESQRYSISEKPVQKKTGGVLHVDAKGNRAIVYPDGSFEEVK